MIKVYTEVMNTSSKKTLLDVEIVFEILIRRQESFSDSIYTKIMQDIDGVITREGLMIETKFGRTNLLHLSTGCKSAMLVYYYRNSSRYVTSIVGCGWNAVEEIFLLARDFDIQVYTPFSIEIDEHKFADIECTIDGKKFTALDLLGYTGVE